LLRKVSRFLKMDAGLHRVSTPFFENAEPVVLARLELFHTRIVAKSIQVGINTRLEEIAEAAVVGVLQTSDRFAAILLL
jgi:hypothetical protein